MQSLKRLLKQVEELESRLECVINASPVGISAAIQSNSEYLHVSVQISILTFSFCTSFELQMRKRQSTFIASPSMLAWMAWGDFSPFDLMTSMIRARPIHQAILLWMTGREPSPSGATFRKPSGDSFPSAQTSCAPRAGFLQLR